MQKLFIRNMVCQRCIKIVRSIFDDQQIPYTNIVLGVVDLEFALPVNVLEATADLLDLYGFELIDGQDYCMVQMIKKEIITVLNYGDLHEMRDNFPAFLFSRLHRDYLSLSRLFSSIENISIEQFIAIQKIEKVKEWLVYDDMPLGEIAFRLAFSNTVHLSTQFKKMIGFSPAQFKKLKEHKCGELNRMKQGMGAA